jgi:hypothetical protein
MVNWSTYLTVTILPDTEGTSELPILSGLPTTRHIAEDELPKQIDGRLREGLRAVAG